MIIFSSVTFVYFFFGKMGTAHKTTIAIMYWTNTRTIYTDRYTNLFR